MTTHDSGFGAIIILEHALHVATLAIRSPIGLLGVIGLHHVLSLHLQGDDEIWRRIRVRLPGLSKLNMAWHVVLFSAIEESATRIVIFIPRLVIH